MSLLCIWPNGAVMLWTVIVAFLKSRRLLIQGEQDFSLWPTLVRFSQVSEICAYWTTKGLGPSTAWNLGTSGWISYSSYTVFFIQQGFFMCWGAYYYSVLRLYQEKLPSSSPYISRHAADVHSATCSRCPKELTAEMGREPQAGRREVTGPKSGAGARSRAVLSRLLPGDQTTPPLQGVWSVITKDHVALVSFTVGAV